MKFGQEKYRIISIWMSLIIIALAFVAGSDDESRPIVLALAFALGTILYGVGGFFEWKRKQRIACAVESVLAVLMCAAAILSLFRMGGIL